MQLRLQLLQPQKQPLSTCNLVYCIDPIFENKFKNMGSFAYFPNIFLLHKNSQ